VAIGIGAANTKRSWVSALRLAAAFGLFQFAMPIAGWLSGLTVVNIIGGFDHWIAFALLTYVGGKMIWEGCKDESEEEKPTRRAVCRCFCYRLPQVLTLWLLVSAFLY